MWMWRGQSKLHEAGREQGHKESVRAQEEGSHQGLHVQQVHAKMKMKGVGWRYRKGKVRSGGSDGGGGGNWRN